MCPDKELLSAYVDGEVPSPWRERIVDHLESCAACAAAVGDFAGLGDKLRAADEVAETSIRARLDARLEAEFAAAAMKRRSLPPRPLSARGSWRRSVAVPLPMAAAAALAILLLSSLAVLGFMRREARQAPAVASAEIAPPPAQPASLDALLKYLDSKDAQVTLTIRLPSGATLDSAGNPMLVREQTPTQGTPVSAPPSPDSGEAPKDLQP